MNRRQLLISAGLSAAASALKGQEFEVASIKPSAPSAGGRFTVGIQVAPGGRLTTSGTSARFLIQQAYSVRDFQIVGGPSWMGTERYDITAKGEGATKSDDIKPMIQALLADRFKLKFHRETKEMQTYALVVAKGGPKLTRSAAVEESDKPKRGGMMRMGRGQFTAQDMGMAGLVNQLSQVLSRSVIDKTELTGNFDFKLEWTPDEADGAMFKGGEAHPEAKSDVTGPSLYTALQEQLGLKLESTRGPVEILTIDSIEKPSEN